mgnify:FL=1
MIDIENQLYTLIKAVLPTGTSMSGEYSPNATLPLLTMEMKDNSTYDRSYTMQENHVRTMFEFNAFSNKTSGAKTQCKNIIAKVDAEMLSLGFVRTTYSFVPNLLDATVKRLTARYVGVVGANKTVYRR